MSETPTDKVYPNNMPIFQLPSCSEQYQEELPQELNIYNANNAPAENNYYPTENYNPLGPKLTNTFTNVNSFVSNNSNYLEVSNWDTASKLTNETDKAHKLNDKIDLVELSSKDFSPVSYCSSNLDTFLPDIYKSISKENNANHQWLQSHPFGHNNQACYEYSSCSQAESGYNNIAKTVKYCRIQKDVESPLRANSSVWGAYDSYHSDHLAVNNTSYNYQQEQHNMLGYFQSHLYGQSIDQISLKSITNIDQQTEYSNDESDIIVEESDDNTTELSESQERSNCENKLNKCVVCNTCYTPLGTQFFLLTKETPLTMSSQKPVNSKIVEIIGKMCKATNYLCKECLCLINSIDHLQMKLEQLNGDVRKKFQKTCQENNAAATSNASKTKNWTNDVGKKLTRVKCKQCKKIFSLQKICLNHLRKHRKKILCELCGKVFLTKKQFFSHKQTHLVKSTAKRILAYKCTNCPKYFRTHSNRKDHENYCLGLLNYQCQYSNCSEKFPSKTKLSSHIKAKHEKKFVGICSICNIGFVTNYDYKTHKIVHSTDKKYSCSKCDKSYKTMNNLKFHMKVHDKQLPFICEMCSKGFMRKEYWQDHMNKHKGVKNFTCNLCSKKFVSQKYLDSHLKFHTDKKTCKLCAKTVLLPDMEEHMRIHNVLFQSECDICGLKVKNKRALAHHKKNKHNIVCAKK